MQKTDPSDPENQIQCKVQKNFFFDFENEYVLNASAQDVVCKDANIRLSPNTFFGPGVEFEWNGPNDFSSREMEPVIPKATEKNEGRYQLTTFIKDPITQEECSYQSEFDLTLSRLSVTHSGDFVCTGDKALVQLDVEGGVEPYEFSWNGSVSDSPERILRVGNHEVEITGQAGCKINHAITVEEIPKPTLKVEEDQCSNLILSLLDSETNEQLTPPWTISPNSNMSEEEKKNYVIKYSYNGCDYEEPYPLREGFFHVYVPNGFSPDGEGAYDNERFGIFASNDSNDNGN